MSLQESLQARPVSWVVIIAIVISLLSMVASWSGTIAALGSNSQQKRQNREHAAQASAVQIQSVIDQQNYHGKEIDRLTRSVIGVRSQLNQMNSLLLRIAQYQGVPVRAKPRVLR